MQYNHCSIIISKKLLLLHAHVDHVISLNFHQCDIKYLGLCYFYKLVSNLFEFPDCPLIPRVLNYPTCNGGADLFVHPRANFNTYHNSFSPSIISQWNSFPACVTSAPMQCVFIQEAVRQCTLK